MKISALACLIFLAQPVVADTIAIIGTANVGLPLGLAFAEQVPPTLFRSRYLPLPHVN